MVVVDLAVMVDLPIILDAWFTYVAFLIWLSWFTLLNGLSSCDG